VPRTVTYSLGTSLDGYAMDPDGRFDWAAPDDKLFRFAIEQIRRVDVHLMGRRLYETMRYWEDEENAAGFGDAEREWAALWNPLPKVVFSRTLTSVEGSGARLATGSLAQEVARLRAEGDGEIAIGGPTLAVQAADLSLVDEYRPKVHPVLLGGGTPFFPQSARQQDLELVETRTFPSGTVYACYRRRSG
jgi:dihydrofolate reductase